MALLVSYLDSSDSSPWKLDDSSPSSQKLDGSSARRGSRRSGGRDVDNGDAFEAEFKDGFTPEEIARADASRIWGPAPFDSGDGLWGVVHGPNQCASGMHCMCPGGDISKSTHKCSGCQKPIHSSVCAKWCVEGGKMWCVFCKKPNPEPQDLMENKELRDCCQRVC